MIVRVSERCLVGGETTVRKTETPPPLRLKLLPIELPEIVISVSRELHTENKLSWL